MLDLLRAWDLAQEDLLIFAPEESLASAAGKLLDRLEHGKGTPCGIVQDENGRFLGTLSTHRALRAVGQALQNVKAFDTPGVNIDEAVHAVCHMVGGHTVADHMYTKSLQVPPSLPLHEILSRFADNTGHFAVVIEAGKALGLLELDDIFKTFAQEMLNDKPSPM